MSAMCSRCGRAVSGNYSKERQPKSNQINVSVTNLAHENDANLILQDKDIKGRIVEARNLFEKSDLVVNGRILTEEEFARKYPSRSQKFSVASITNRLFKHYHS